MLYILLYILFSHCIGIKVRDSFIHGDSRLTRLLRWECVHWGFRLSSGMEWKGVFSVGLCDYLSLGETVHSFLLPTQSPTGSHHSTLTYNTQSNGDVHYTHKQRHPQMTIPFKCVQKNSKDIPHWSYGSVLFPVCMQNLRQTRY